MATSQLLADVSPEKNAVQEFELDYWSNKFGINKEELKRSILSGKPSSLTIEQFVKRSINEYPVH